MGYKHTREDILEGAMSVVGSHGFTRLSFGRVAKHLGISDRVVVYYFPTKDDLIGDVLLTMGVALQQQLAAAFTEVASDHLELVQSAWPVLSSDDADPVFALFFEANGLAAAGQQPYATLVPQLVAGWTDWLVSFVDGPPDIRQQEAEAAIAVIDGLLLLRLLSGPEAAERAGRALGVR